MSHYLLSQGSCALRKHCQDPCTALPCPALCPLQHLSSAKLARSDYLFQKKKEQKYVHGFQCFPSHFFLAACPHTERFSGLGPPTWNIV